MNKNGQTTMLAILFGIFIFLTGIVIVNFLTDDVDTARNSLECSTNQNITDGTRLTCLFVDITVPYFIILIISLAGGLLMRRLRI